MHLSLRQLTTFREVMRSGSISQAARSVGRTQPAVSTMIRTLEDQLGFALFVRDRASSSPRPRRISSARNARISSAAWSAPSAP